eukprot:scaffold2928_cov23-Tisochrysis_lutea.AAC.5
MLLNAKRSQNRYGLEVTDSMLKVLGLSDWHKLRQQWCASLKTKWSPKIACVQATTPSLDAVLRTMSADYATSS